MSGDWLQCRSEPPVSPVLGMMSCDYSLSPFIPYQSVGAPVCGQTWGEIVFSSMSVFYARLSEGEMVGL